MSEFDRIDKEELALHEIQAALMSFLTYCPGYDMYHNECMKLVSKTTERLSALESYRDQLVSSAETSAGM